MKREVVDYSIVCKDSDSTPFYKLAKLMNRNKEKQSENNIDSINNYNNEDAIDVLCHTILSTNKGT